MTAEFSVGSLVAARGREWVVLPDSTPTLLIVRPLGGSQDDIAALLVEVEQPQPARFSPPTVDDLGDQVGAALLRTALQIGFRSSAGPFRSLASLAVEPRSYQLVPLLMALRQPVTRLLIADDVGVGKTIEAGLIAAELLATGDARRLAVLCSPALAGQWQEELRTKFGLDAEQVLPSTVKRLERDRIGAESLFERYPITIVSTDFIKSDRRRHEFLRACPDLVIVDEAHTCVAASDARGGRGRQRRHELVSALAQDASRHLLLVTATPHSGKDESFRALLALLDPSLADVALDDRAGREHLARFMVQRRRADIRRYLDEDTPFPKDRLTSEVSYDLSPAYRALFEKVVRLARETAQDESGGPLRQRVRWWSALALLRALASSPRAAAATLSTRAAAAEAESLAEADELGRAVVLDQPEDEALEGADVTPGADPEAENDETPYRKRLRSLSREAETLAGPPDTKLAAGTDVVRDLLKAGDDPIVFCRFINTAEYVGEHLKATLGRKVTVDVVTGSLPPEERAARVKALSLSPGRRVLVATDCLSEGVNLQDAFSAVIHYDLAWNPTRHEQREGRVDRFGQQRTEVKAVTLYGRDNGIDGIVLDVLLRKHAEIRKATGVSVPVPDDSGGVLEAVLEGLLLRGQQPEQLALDIGFAKREELHAGWQSSAEKESKAVTRFAQSGIRPEAVAAELAEVRSALGSLADVKAFTRASLTALGGQVTTTPTGFTISTGLLPAALLDALPPGSTDPLPFSHALPAPRGTAVLNRTDPTVGALARHVLDTALDPTLPEAARPARRCGVIRTRAVTRRTTVLLVRYRFSLVLPARSGDRTLVAEEAVLLAIAGSGETAQWLEPGEVNELVTSRADANVAPDAAPDFITRALAGLPALEAQVAHHGEVLASQLRESHRRVRDVSGDIRRGLTVTPHSPADIVGVYVYLPMPS